MAALEASLARTGAKHSGEATTPRKRPAKKAAAKKAPAKATKKAAKKSTGAAKRTRKSA